MPEFRLGDRVRVHGSEPEDDDGIIVGVGRNAFYVEFPGGMPPIPFQANLLEKLSSDAKAPEHGGST